MRVCSLFTILILCCLINVDSLTPKKFVVFGSSGKTGASIVRRILSQNIPDCQIICPVRDMAKARAVLGPESKCLSLVPCNLDFDDKEKFVSILSGADAVIISSAYSPGAIADLFSKMKRNYSLIAYNQELKSIHCEHKHYVMIW
jgi:saccharopine dehydrogenase-like NADP-dependent oxidoreductase